MMVRLPIVGGDVGDWGTILNDFLEVSLNQDGTIQPGAIVQAGAVTSVNTVTPSPGGNVTLTAGEVGAVATSQVGAANGVASLDSGGNVPAGELAYAVVAVPPSGDASGATDTAAINAVAQAGAVAQLQAGTYHITNLLIDSFGGIAGQGYASVLRVVGGATGYAVALLNPASTQQILLRDFMLTPDVPVSSGGVLLDNTGFGTSSDPRHTVDNVYCQSFSGDSFHFDNNARSLTVIRCRSAGGVGGSGFYLGPGLASSGKGCTDSVFTDCRSSQSASHGWYIDSGSWNNIFTACKAGYSGYSDGAWDTTHCGWYVNGTHFNVFAGCCAQSNAVHGFYLTGSTEGILSACEADTNGGGGTGTAAGIWVDSSTGCAVTGCTGGNNPSGQAYGIGLSGTQSGVVLDANTITGSTAQYSLSGIGYSFGLQSAANLSDVASQQAALNNIAGAVTAAEVLAGDGSNVTMRALTAADLPVVSGQYPCAPTSYAPTSQTILSTTSATLAQASSSVSTGSFTAPPSGSVVVTVSFADYNASSAHAYYGLSDHGNASSIRGDVQCFTVGASVGSRILNFSVTGLTASDSYDFDLVFATVGGTLEIYAYGQSASSPSNTPGAPVVMTVQVV